MKYSPLSKHRDYVLTNAKQKKYSLRFIENNKINFYLYKKKTKNDTKYKFNIPNIFAKFNIT